MSNFKTNEGKRGEEIAADFLKKQGCEILVKNFRAKSGEVDIIALDKYTLVFVEVKTRKSFEYGLPIEAITKRKIKSIINVAQYFKLTHPKLPESLRIDAVSVKLNQNNEAEEIEHFKNISGL